jgi:4'-phosphopantetheinyl transferase
MLSASERLHYDRLALADDRRDYVAAHALLRIALSRYRATPPDGWAFDRNVYGKPRVRPEDDHSALQFNLSHARGLVACIVSPSLTVGIDVERVDRLSRYPQLHERSLSGPERVELATMAEHVVAERFTDLWTLKEALLKAVGVGLAVEPSEVSFSLGAGQTITPRLPARLSRTAFHLALYQPSPHHRMAVAVEMAHADPVRVVARNAEDGAELPIERST